MTKKRGSYNRYPDEFKKDAVSLILEQDYTPQQAAEAVGVNVKLIYNWKNKIEEQNKPVALGELTRESMTIDVQKYIRYYNHERLHTTLGDIPPVAYEKRIIKVSNFG